MSQAVN